jgi:capsular polysaccharide biosynthesis protein
MPEFQEEEIDLREYINVLLKRKGIIILIFLIAVITAALVSYFAISPVYQSSMVFSVAKIEGRPVINITEALEIIKSNVLLDEAIDRMGLEETTKKLSSQVTTESLKGTNFIKVSAEHDPSQPIIPFYRTVIVIEGEGDKQKIAGKYKEVHPAYRHLIK